MAVLSILLFFYAQIVVTGLILRGSDNNTTSDDILDEIFSKYNIPYHTGRVDRDVLLNSSDEKAILTIPCGTIASNPEGRPLLWVELFSLDVGTVAAYDLEPDGATFSPAARLSITYDTSNIPEGGDESCLLIKMYENGKWMPLKTSIDPSTHTASSDIFQITTFAVFFEKSSFSNVVESAQSEESESEKEEPKEPPPNKDPPAEPPPKEHVNEPAIWGDEPVSEEEEVEEEPGFEVVMAIPAMVISILFINRRKKST